jgi:hypothetical protein
MSLIGRREPHLAAILPAIETWDGFRGRRERRGDVQDSRKYFFSANEGTVEFEKFSRERVENSGEWLAFGFARLEGGWNERSSDEC